MPLDVVLQQNDTGISIIVTVVQNDGTTPVDLSSATSLTIYLFRPDSSLIVGTASLVNDGKDGKIQYVTQLGDLGMQGIYKVQAEYLIGSSIKHTTRDNFVVEPNLPGVE